MVARAFKFAWERDHWQHHFDAAMRRVTSEQKFTQPPAQFSEATLVKALEEKFGVSAAAMAAPAAAAGPAAAAAPAEEEKIEFTMAAVVGLATE